MNNSASYYIDGYKKLAFYDHKIGMEINCLCFIFIKMEYENRPCGVRLIFLMFGIEELINYRKRKRSGSRSRESRKQENHTIHKKRKNF